MANHGSPHSDTATDLVFTVAEAARLLKVSKNHFYGLIAQDLVPHVRYGKLIRVPAWALLQHLASASGSPQPANLDVAFLLPQSVDGQRPIQKEE